MFICAVLVLMQFELTPKALAITPKALAITPKALAITPKALANFSPELERSDNSGI